MPNLFLSVTTLIYMIYIKCVVLGGRRWWWWMVLSVSEGVECYALVQTTTLCSKHESTDGRTGAATVAGRESCVWWQLQLCIPVCVE